MGDENPIDALGVRMNDVRVRYGSGGQAVQALRGLSLTVPRGQFLAVRGPSGSGKSTLLRAIAGLEPLEAGNIVVGGVDLSECSDDRRSALRRRSIGFVHQLLNLLPDMSALQNVALPLRLDGIRDPDARERSLKAMSLVGVETLGERFPSEMSGGEMLRVAIARAIVNDPIVVLADEPTGSLDRETTRRVLRLLQEVHDANGATLIIATHDEEVARAAQRVVELVDGEILSNR